MRVIDKLKGEFSFLYGNVLILMISWILMDFAGPIPNTYYSLYVLKLGGTPFIVGFIGFASMMVLALVQFLGGYLADKYGRKKLIVTMTFGFAASYTFYALAPTWYFVLIGAVLQSLCSINLPALWAIMTDSLPPEKRGIGYSVRLIVSAVSMLSPLIAGFLYVRYGLVHGMRIAYLTAMILYLVAAATMVRLRETLKIKAEGIHFRNIMQSYPRAIRESIGVWSCVPRPAFYLFLTFVIIPFFFVGMCQPYYIIYATDVLHIEEFQWALLLMWRSIVTLGSALPVGKLVDKIGRKKLLLASSFLYMPGVWFFVYGDLPRLILSFLLFGISNSSLSIAYPSMEADLVPREHRGKVLGCRNFFGGILASVGQLIGGFLYEGVSPQLPLLLLLISTIPSALLTLLLIHEPGKREV